MRSIPVVAHIPFRVILLWVVLLCFPFSALAEGDQSVDAMIREADELVRIKDWDKAEDVFARILQADPKNWRVMHSLAQVKFQLNKFEEAEKIVSQILAMPVADGRDVLVYYPGSTTPEIAELVDEIVLPPQRTNDNMRNYLDIKGNAPIPHYRLFFVDKKKMELVPQSVVRLEYQGVLRTVYEKVAILKQKVDKALIASGGSEGLTEMVEIKGGCFQMGSQQGTPIEQPVHEVCLKDFKLDKHEVTQAQFQAAMEMNPAQLIGPQRPADSVTWFEADRYCKKAGKRLPTEAEWEFAARGGTDTHFYWGNSVKGNEANFCDKNCELNIRVAAVDDGSATTTDVGQYPANAFGLYDMAGNVAEWVSDWMDVSYYRNSPKDNPQGGSPSDHKIARGGAWNTTAGFLRSSNRAGYQPDVRGEGLGFRCAADL